MKPTKLKVKPSALFKVWQNSDLLLVSSHSSPLPYLLHSPIPTPISPALPYPHSHISCTPLSPLPYLLHSPIPTPISPALPYPHSHISCTPLSPLPYLLHSPIPTPISPALPYPHSHTSCTPLSPLSYLLHSPILHYPITTELLPTASGQLLVLHRPALPCSSLCSHGTHMSEHVPGSGHIP